MKRITLAKNSRIESVFDMLGDTGHGTFAGAVHEVEMRAIGSASTRKLSGSWTLVRMDAWLDPRVMMATVARESDLAMEQVSGELVTATVITGWGLTHNANDGTTNTAADTSPAHSAWADVVKESAREVPRGTRETPATHRGPDRPPARRESVVEDDEFLLQPPDRVDHFAFGRCEILKSDGDRLHLKVGRDGRIKEIALAMLRINRLADEDGFRLFRLERKM